jgi:hypothetical protein
MSDYDAFARETTELSCIEGVQKIEKSAPLKLMTRISRTTPFNVRTSRGSIRDVSSDSRDGP